METTAPVFTLDADENTSWTILDIIGPPLELDRITESMNQLDALRPVFCTVFIIILALGLCGNLSVLFMVARYKSIRRRVINAYYVNIALADILLCITGTGYDLGGSIVGKWFGITLCSLLVAFRHTALFVHIGTLLVIGFYHAVSVFEAARNWGRPLEASDANGRLPLLSRTKLISVLLWILGSVGGLTFSVFYAKLEASSQSRCVIRVPKEDLPATALITTTLWIFGPIILILFCWMFVACVVCRRRSRGVITTKQEATLISYQSSMRLLVLITFLFCLCQAPAECLKWFIAFGAYASKQLRGNRIYPLILLTVNTSKVCVVTFTAVFFCYTNDKYYSSPPVVKKKSKRCSDQTDIERHNLIASDLASPDLHQNIQAAIGRNSTIVPQETSEASNELLPAVNP